MKYPWLALSIAIIWFMATFSVLVSDDTNINQVISVALLSTTILAYFGFRSPK